MKSISKPSLSRLPSAILALSLMGVFAAGTAEAAQATAATAVAEDSFDAALAPYFKANLPGVSVIMTRAGKTIFRKSYGSADLDAKTALRPDMMFRVGSVSKQFTSAAIFQLIEAGKLKLDDDINALLPELPNQGEKITLEQVLSHTSGLKDYVRSPKFAETAGKPITRQQIFELFKNDGLAFPPGQGFAYSNTGYFLLGMIIEKVSGMSYEDYLAKHIFEPLKMTHTAYEGRERDAQRRVEGYMGQGDKVQKADPISIDVVYAAGGLVSTVDDLATWDRAIAEGKLLKPSSWTLAMQPHKIHGTQNAGYGYGWNNYQIRGARAIGHDGIIPGFNAFAVRIPEHQLYVAVLGNNGFAAPNSAYLVEKIAAIAMGNPYPDYKAVQLDPDSMEKFVGVYKINDKDDRTISREDNRLFMQRSGRGKFEVLPCGPTEFFIKDSPSRVHLRFVAGAAGAFDQLIVTQNDLPSTENRKAGR